MNQHEAVIYAGNLFHLLIWCYVTLAWLLPYAKYHVLFIVTILLPVIYIVQSMPCHFLMYAKLKYIQKHRSSFKTLTDYQLGGVDRNVLENISKSLNWDVKELHDLLLVLKAYEFDLQIPKILESGRQVFEGKSFENPFSPQGMIVFAYVINVFALLYLYRKSCQQRFERRFQRN